MAVALVFASSAVFVVVDFGVGDGAVAFGVGDGAVTLGRLRGSVFGGVEAMGEPDAGRLRVRDEAALVV